MGKYKGYDVIGLNEIQKRDSTLKMDNFIPSILLAQFHLRNNYETL